MKKSTNKTLLAICEQFVKLKPAINFFSLVLRHYAQLIHSACFLINHKIHHHRTLQ